MRFSVTRVLLFLAVVPVPHLKSQTLNITGSVRDGNGHPLNASLITVSDAHGQSLGKTTSNSRGYYSIQAKSGAVSVSCEVFADSRYSPNPDLEKLTIKSDMATGDCVLFQVTNNTGYWMEVAKTVDMKGHGVANSSETYTLAWKKIDSSGLPPDSKAVAADQFKAMNWTTKIADRKFVEYVGVDKSTLSRAIGGDGTALAGLPPSVADDVRAYVYVAK